MARIWFLASSKLLYNIVEPILIFRIHDNFLLKRTIVALFPKWVAVHFETIKHSSTLKKKEKKVEVEKKSSFYN